MAGIFPMLLVPADLALFLSGFAYWGPTVIAIAVALLVAAVLGSKRLSLASAMTIGVVFEIAGGYGIAVAEYTDPMVDLHARAAGLSWVAVWTVLFTVVVPTRPRRALLAALVTVSSVPVLVSLVMAYGRPGFRPDPGQFFFWFVFPYLLVVAMAYVGSRVVYAAGHRGQARARAGELPAGGEARRGRDGRGLARQASDAGEARGHQAHPAVARGRRERRRRLGRGATGASSARRR